MVQLQSIILCYNADWSLKGGLEYLRETIKGDEPCELCRITYGGLTKKGSWKKCEKEIKAPVEERYKNKLEPELAEALAGRFPAVVARTDAGYRVLIVEEEMNAMGGDPLKLYEALVAALEREAIRVTAA